MEVDSPGEKGRMQGLEQKPGGKQNKGQKGSNLINRLTNTNTNTGSHRNGPQSIGSHSWPRIHSIQRERFKWPMEAMLVEAGGRVELEAGFSVV